MLEIRCRDILRGIEHRVQTRAFGIVNRYRRTRLVDQVGEVAQLLLRRRDGIQERPSHALARPLVGEREEGLAAPVIKLRDVHRTAHAETELIAPQDVALASALHDFMRNGVEGVVADVLVDAAVPQVREALVRRAPVADAIEPKPLGLLVEDAQRLLHLGDLRIDLAGRALG